MNIKKPIFLFILLYAISFQSAIAQTKLVFAHYMVCFTPYDNGSVEGYKREIQEAQQVGVDGFALNCGDWNAAYKQNATRMFQAALELKSGFKLFFSADQGCCMHDEYVMDMVKTFSGHPNYFHYKKRPFLASWSGPSMLFKDEWMKGIIGPLKKLGYNVYFVPFMYPVQPVSETPGYDLVLQNYNTWWKYFFDGYFYFGAAGLPDYTSKPSLLKAGEAFAKVFHDSTKTYMASVSPQYWGDKQTGGRRYYDYKGGEGLAAQWKSIIEVQKPEWVEMVTWNDWEEWSYFSPMDDVSKYNKNTSHPDLGFHKTHRGFAFLNKYYIQWYKTGKQPAIKDDQLFFFYRTNPKDIVATDDPRGPVTTQWGNVTDEIYITTILKAPAELVVTSGSVETKYTIAKGIVHTRVPFHIGRQHFEINRNQVKLLDAEGEAIVDKAKIYNFDTYSGFASN